MPVGLRLLLSDYEKARATGDIAKARAILKDMEKVGLPDYLKPKKTSPRATRKQSGPGKYGAGTKIDPGRF